MILSSWFLSLPVVIGMLFERGRKQKQTQEGRKAVWVSDTIICTLGLTCVQRCRSSATSTVQDLEGVFLFLDAVTCLWLGDRAFYR